MDKRNCKMSRMTLLLLLGLLLLNLPEISARRGRARSRSKSRVQIGLPITGKYRDPESDKYYNNDQVRIFANRKIFYHLIIFVKQKFTYFKGC